MWRYVFNNTTKPPSSVCVTQNRKNEKLGKEEDVGTAR